MTRPLAALLTIGCVAGVYAAVALALGHLTEFAYAIILCAAAVITAHWLSLEGERRRETMSRGRAQVWERRDTECGLTPIYHVQGGEIVGQES